LTHTITLVADHKGQSKPSVLGDEYVVLGDMTTTAYRVGSPANASVNINAATDETLTRASGSFITDGFVVGDYCTIVGSAGANDAHLMQIKTLTATVLTTEADTALSADTGGGEVITHAGEKILASSFGLSTFTHVEVVGQESLREKYYVTSPRDSGKHVYLYALSANGDGTNAASHLVGDTLVGGANVATGTTTLGSIRLKAIGNL